MEGSSDNDPARLASLNEGVFPFDDYDDDDSNLNSTTVVNSTRTESDKGTDFRSSAPFLSYQQEFLLGAEEGDLPRLRFLLTSRPHLIDETDGEGYSALHRAAYSDQVSAAELLLGKGADVNARTHDGWTPLLSAARWDAHRVLKVLLKNGASVNAKSNGAQTALHLAAAGRDSSASLTLLLLHPQIKVDMRNGAGDLPLEIAQRSGNNSYLFELARPSLNNF